jgi:hypothetical protein
MFNVRHICLGTAWLVFLFCCFQQTFLRPYVLLVPGERANVFSGLLCAMAFLAALLVLKTQKPIWRWPEIFVCLCLSGLAVASAWYSLVPFSAGLRVFVLLSSGLGGFWCARILLNDEVGRDRFFWLCLVLLIVASVVGLVGFFILGRPSYILGTHEHPVNAILLLLWVGPLGLAATGRIKLKLASMVLGLSYVVVILSGKMSAVWIPILAGAIGAVLMIRQKGRIVIILLALLGIAIFLSFYYVPGRYGASSLSVWFRAENYPASLHIAKQRPVLGIGLCALRQPYLDDYKVQYPGITKNQFEEMLITNRSSENVFLTFITDLGFPFCILYVLSLSYLLWKLLECFSASYCEGVSIELAILIPIVAVLFYSWFFDTLLYPQVNWFFHVLLGMIPSGGNRESQGR